MKVWCGLFVMVLLVSSSVSASGRVATLFDKFGHMTMSKGNGLVSKAASLLAAGFIVCTGMSCDTNTVIKVTENVHTEREVQVTRSYQEIYYYVIDGIAWPYYAVAVPDYGYPEVIDRDCDYMPMEMMYDAAVPDHEYVGDDVVYISPPYGDVDPYYNYGKVKRYYNNGFYEVEVYSWSESYSYTERTTLQRTFTVLIDSTISADEGGIFLDIGELE